MVKRWFVDAFLAGVLMLADGAALIVVTGAFPAHQVPVWATAPFFWSLAWSVQLLSLVIPMAPGGGPSMVAVAGGALIDLVLFSLLVDWLLRHRRQSQRRTPPFLVRSVAP